MPISTTESTSTRKSIDLAVVPSATGITVSGTVRWFNEQFEIPATFIPCVFTHPQSYAVALARAQGGVALILGDEDGLPSGYEEICAPIRFRLASPDDTCETVKIEVARRVLVPDPPTVITRPKVDVQPKLDENGEPVIGLDGRPEMIAVQVVIDGVPQEETIVIPPEPLPEPTVVEVSPTPIIPTKNIEKQLRYLDAQCVARIFAGYDFRGVRFSMSQNAQANMQYFLTLALNAPQLLGLPITMPNIDDTVFLRLETVEDVVAMATAMAQHKRAAIDACSVAKEATRKAS